MNVNITLINILHFKPINYLKLIIDLGNACPSCNVVVLMHPGRVEKAKNIELRCRRFKPLCFFKFKIEEKMLLKTVKEIHVKKCK